MIRAESLLTNSPFPSVKLPYVKLVVFIFQTMYSRVPACQISTYYYVGFAYMMMRRYQDAIRTFSDILLYIQRTKQMYQNKTYLYDQVCTVCFQSGMFIMVKGATRCSNNARQKCSFQDRKFEEMSHMDE